MKTRKVSYNLNKFQKGMVVFFGRDYFDQTKGIVKKVNRKRLKVKILEKRGKNEKGAEFYVPPSFVREIGLEGPETPMIKDLEEFVESIDDSIEEIVEEGHQKLQRNCDLKNPPTYIKKSRHYLDGTSLTQHNKEYDGQKSKLYDAERQIGTGKQFNDIWEARKYLKKLLSSGWFQRRFGDIGLNKLKKGRSNSRSAFYGKSKNICLSPNHFNELILLHELTHVIVPKPHAPHGRLFARIYMALVERKMGRETYESLRDSFKSYGVKYSPYHNRNR